MSKEEVIHVEDGAPSYSICFCYRLETSADKEVHKDFTDVLMSCVKELARRGGCHCTHITPDETSGFVLTSSDANSVNHSWDRIYQFIERLDTVTADSKSSFDYRITVNGPTIHPFNKKIALSAKLEAELAFLRRCLG